MLCYAVLCYAMANPGLAITQGSGFAVISSGKYILPHIISLFEGAVCNCVASSVEVAYSNKLNTNHHPITLSF